MRQSSHPKTTAVVAGDWNCERTQRDLEDFTSSLTVFQQGGGNPADSYTNLELPPTTQQQIRAGEATEIRKVATCIDQIFGYDGREGGRRLRAEVTNMRRLMLLLGDFQRSDRAQWTQNGITWLEMWNDVWSKQGAEGINVALETASRLNAKVISDHFPVTSDIEIQF